jgi:hypothetical protein
MAQTGYTPIQLYHSTTLGAAPTAGNLAAGELAININDADMALYAENASGVVTRVINNPAGLKYPTADGTAGQVVTTDGVGNLAFSTPAAGASLSVANTWTALQTFSDGSVSTPERETSVNIAASNIDLSAGNYFNKTITGNITFTVSNVPASGTAQSFILELVNGGAFTVTWFAGLTFPGGTAPTLTASGRDVLAFFTRDGGTTWSGFLVGKDVKGP